MQPLFRFGLISDTQYVDADDGSNFGGTRIRRYRHSLQILKRAVASWNQLHADGKPLSFVVQLGDLIDGKCKQLGQTQAAVQELKPVIQASECKEWHFCIGNHEMYNYSTAEWVEEMFPPGQAQSYYDFSPHKGWRVVVLNSYEVSVMAPKGSAENLHALDVLKTNNPNDVINDAGSWFKDLEGEQRRFVPYNGQFSAAQLAWFKDVVETAAGNRERVLVACHQPCYSKCTNFENLPFNFQEALNIMHSRPGTVVAWVAGHDHDGGYAFDNTGIHHIVPAAPLECQLDEDAFGFVEVLPEDNGFRIHWTGKMPDKGQWPDILLPITSKCRKRDFCNKNGFVTLGKFAVLFILIIQFCAKQKKII